MLRHQRVMRVCVAVTLYCARMLYMIFISACHDMRYAMRMARDMMFFWRHRLRRFIIADCRRHLMSLLFFHH